ncbi:amidohydrolase family protein [Arthrobacter sp. PAMC 25486]|uniref:amidohydrolase family protein n=1 Tax=Arthrobacter sp. PAMC 25486 TaxID=1494608 RepID=UPI00138E46E3
MVAQLSGLTTEVGWEARTTAELGDVVEHALEVFGSKWPMFGTDCPVAVLAGAEAIWPRVLTLVLDGPGSDVADAIFGGNTRRVYRLDHGRIRSWQSNGMGNSLEQCNRLDRSKGSRP